MRWLLLVSLLTVTSCTMNRARHYDAAGRVDADLSRYTFLVNATATITWDGEKFTFDYNQQSDAAVKALQALAPLLQQAAVAGRAAK